MISKSTLFGWIIHFKIRTERGQAWINGLKTPVILAAGLKIFGLGSVMSILMVPVILFLTYFIGVIDLKKGIWLRESETVTREYNPYFKGLERKVEERL